MPGADRDGRAGRFGGTAGPVLGVLGASLLLYLTTMPPDLMWGGGDFARFQTWAYLGSSDSQVTVFTHPLWVWLAHPFSYLPIGVPAWRASLAAGFFASATLGLVFLSSRVITQSNLASLLAVASLAVSHTFWTYAVLPKVYSLNTLLLALVVALLLAWRSKEHDRYLYLGSFLYGLSFLNHLVMATAAAGLLAFVLHTLVHSVAKKRSGRVSRPLALAGLFFTLGLSPYLTLVSRGGTGASNLGTVLRFLRGLIYPLREPGALVTGLGWGSALWLYQFPLTFLVGLLGLRWLWRRDRGVAWLILLGGLGSLLFLLAAVDPATGGAYVWNLHYYLQAYLLFTLALAAGFHHRMAIRPGRRGARPAILALASVAFPVTLYAAAPTLAGLFWPQVPDFRPLPGRDNYRYALSPWKHLETGPRPYAESILAALPENSILVADYSIWSMLRYLQLVEDKRRDVELVLLPPRGEQGPVLETYRLQDNLFLADTYRYYDLEVIEGMFDLQAHGPIYRLISQPESPVGHGQVRPVASGRLRVPGPCAAVPA